MFHHLKNFMYSFWFSLRFSSEYRKDRKFVVAQFEEFVILLS